MAVVNIMLMLVPLDKRRTLETHDRVCEQQLSGFVSGFTVSELEVYPPKINALSSRFFTSFGGEKDKVTCFKQETKMCSENMPSCLCATSDLLCCPNMSCFTGKKIKRSVENKKKAELLFCLFRT